MQSITPGTSGYVLTSAGAGALPTWSVDGTLNLASSDGRLTLTSGTPVTTADVTAATTLYWTPYAGNQVALYDGSAWAMYTFTERSIAVPATTSQMYDVFVYNNAGAITLELTAWTNDTTRATALTKQDGVYVKTGALTRRYLGSFRTTTVSGQTEDSAAKRFVSNYYNRVVRPLAVFDSTDSWVYQSSTWRQARASTANQVAVVVGVAEDAIALSLQAHTGNSAVGPVANAAIGADSITTPAGISVGGLISYSNADVATYMIRLYAHVSLIPAAGYHYYAWLEASSNVGVQTFYGDVGAPTLMQSGMLGNFKA
jgi:hypothetical protein